MATRCRLLFVLCVAVLLGAAAAGEEFPPDDVAVVVVRGPNGAPVAGASVELLAEPAVATEEIPPEVAITGGTDAEGRARLAVKPFARYMLRVSSPGFATAGDVECFGGNETEFRLSLPAAIHGVVIEEETGKPVPGATVYAFDWCRFGIVSSWTVKTDDRGRYRIEGLPSGRLNVEAWAPGLPWVTLDEALSVAAGSDLPVDIALPPARAVAVTVLDEDTGLPVPEAEIVDHRRRSTKGPGSRIESPPASRAGPWFFWLRAPGFVDGPCPGSSIDIIDPPPASATVTLRRALPVSGIVLGPDGRPAAGIRVRLESVGIGDRARGESSVETMSGPDGRFSVAATASGWVLHWRIPLASGGWRGGPTIDVPEDAKAVALPPISLGGTVSLRGRVLDEAGRPVRRAELEVRPPRGPEPVFRWSYADTVADPRGRFFLAGLPAGKVTVSVSDIAGFASSHRDFDLAKDETVEWKLDSGKEVSGRVVDESGLPIVGVIVEVEGYPLETDHAGRFRLRGLPDEPAIVMVRGRPETWARVEAGTTDLEIVLRAKPR